MTSNAKSEASSSRKGSNDADKNANLGAGQLTSQEASQKKEDVGTTKKAKGAQQDSMKQEAGAQLNTDNDKTSAKEEVSRPSRLVDVINANGTVIHTYPVSLESSEEAADDAAYKSKALEAAASGRLVPDKDLKSLTAKMHVSRGGQMAPYGDRAPIDSETKAGLEEQIRMRAYFLWQNNGRLEGQAEANWHQARDERNSDRAHVLWEQQGRPSDQSV